MDFDDTVPDLEMVDGMEQLSLGGPPGFSSKSPLDAADKMPDSSDDDDDMEEDYEEPEIIIPEPVACFFCQLSDTPDAILTHCIDKHRCDFGAFAKNNRLPTEEIIRMVNFFRTTRPTPEGLPVNICSGQWTESDLQAFRRSWVDDIWMTPAHPSDHGIVSRLVWDWDVPDEQVVSAPFPPPAATSHGITCLQDHGDGCRCSAGVTSAGKMDEDQDKRNSSYFDSYSGFSIHCEMLRDRVRTEAYRSALFATAHNKSVLDIGCGSGVLSCFAAQAGARSVVAVDKADIIDYAQEIALENGLADRIRFIHADLDKTRLNNEKVDVIVSEWMGYFLLFEGMLDSVLQARDTYLAPNGTMIPSTANLYLTAVSDPEAWDNRVGLWDNAYNLKFPCLKEHSLRFPGVDEVNPQHVITERALLRGWDLLQCSVADLQFDADVVLNVTVSGKMTALVGFFDVGYQADDGHKIMLCTSPSDPVTHWAQSVFYLDKPIAVTEDDKLLLNVRISKCRDDHRGLEVVFRMRDPARLANESGAVSYVWQQTYQL